MDLSFIDWLIIIIVLSGMIYSVSYHLSFSIFPHKKKQYEGNCNKY